MLKPSRYWQGGQWYQPLAAIAGLTIGLPLLFFLVRVIFHVQALDVSSMEIWWRTEAPGFAFAGGVGGILGHLALLILPRKR